MYQSPLILAGITGSIIDKKQLQLARRKLLAELELSGRHAININGREFTKQSINSLFEELADEAHLQMHRAIFNNKPLLHFLETANVDPSIGLDFEGINQIAEKLFSSISGSAIQALIQKILKAEAPANHYHAVQNLLNALLPAEVDAALHPAFRFYTTRSRILEDTLANEKAKKPIVLDEAISWISTELIALLNALPDAFADIRYKIARDLNNLAVALETNKKYAAAYDVIQKAVDIETTDSLMSLIRDNLIIHRRKAQEEKERGSYTPAIPPIKTEVITTAGKTYNRRSKNAYLGLLVFMTIFFSLIFLAVYWPSPDQRSIDTHSASDKDHAVLLDSIQLRNKATYKILKMAMIQEPETGVQEEQTIPVYLPCDTCEDGFHKVWSMMLNTIDTMLKDTAGAAQMLLTNKLNHMDVFVLVNVDNRYFNSVYLKPGQTKIYRYKGRQQADFNFYIGSNWNENAWRKVSLPPQSGERTVTYAIQGAFMQVPPNATEYLNAGYGAFARAGENGIGPFRDTANIALSKEGNIEFLLGLDERDF